MPQREMQHDIDPKSALIKALGNIDDLSIYHNQILVAVYLRPKKTKSGIYLPDQHLDEDRNQSKVGLVVKFGPQAFDDPTQVWFKDMEVRLKDWVVFRPSDGWSVTVNGVLCRLLQDLNVKGRIVHPDQVW